MKVININFLQHEDIQTSYVCNICWSKIDDFHEFYETVEKTHREFQHVQQDLDAMKKEDDEYINPTSIKQENDDLEQDYLNVEKNLQLEIEIDYDQDKTSKNPLEECMEENESIDSDEDYDNEDVYNSTSTEDDYKSPIKHEVKEKQTKTSKTSPKTLNKTKKSRRKKSEIEKTDNNSVPKRKKAIFNRLDPVHTEEMILKHIPMGCNLCVFVGKTFSDIVTHFKAEHPDVRPYITCCDKVFTKRFYVAQHAMTHENPNCFR